jgi:hypothetical protein
MQTSHIALPTRGLCVPDIQVVRRAGLILGVIMGAASCSKSDTRSEAVVQDTQRSAVADSLTRICESTGRRGSLLVARVDSTVEEGGVAFDMLGDGAGPGVVLCQDSLYADVVALTALMRDTVHVTEKDGLAVIDGRQVQIPAYYHEGALHVAARPFVRTRRAYFMPSPDHPMDATVWPRSALLHLKASGLTQGRAYQGAFSEGLAP